MAKDFMVYKIKIRIELSFWEALKLRIAGIANMVSKSNKKIKIEELCD